jgi:hypothetical protein
VIVRIDRIRETKIACNPTAGCEKTRWPGEKQALKDFQIIGLSEVANKWGVITNRQLLSGKIGHGWAGGWRGLQGHRESSL